MTNATTTLHDGKTPPRTVEIAPLADTVHCAVAIPGSKSLANRALLLAGVASGASLVSGIPDGDDSQAALAVLGQLGVRHDRIDDETVRVHGAGGAGIAGKTGGAGLAFPGSRRDLDIRSAGTVGRFLPGLLASAASSPDSGGWRLVSTPQLARRPISPLVDALRNWGADIRYEKEGDSFPLLVRGGGLAGGEIAVSAAASTQFASGLLMAAPFAKNGAVVRILSLDPEDRYIASTLESMRHFGAEVESSSGSSANEVVASVRPGAYRARDFSVEADLNAALNFLSLPLLVGGRATITNISGTTTQASHQFLDVLSRLGGVVESGADGISVSGSKFSLLRGGFEINMRPMAEMALSMGVLALFADAPIAMTNLGHIRNHETDRLAALAELLAQVGATVESGADWVRVHPLERGRIRNVVIDSRGDHRIVMAFSLLGLAAGGATIANADSVSKTFPGFFKKLREIGADVRNLGT